MDNQLTFELLAVLVLVLANGFFALAEFSVIASRKSRLREDVEEGKSGAARAEKLKEQPERFLATIQVGITLVSAMLGVFSGATLVAELEIVLTGCGILFFENAATSISLVLVVLSITVLSVVLGELVPKYIALSYPEKYARALSGPVTLFVRATSFFAQFLSSISSMVVRALGVKRDVGETGITEDEINQMIIEGRDRGVFDETEQSFIRSVFDFTDSTVRRAMKPRTDVVGFERSTSLSEILDTIVRHGYSRYPIYEESIDKVIGMLYAKDLIGKDINSSDFSLDELIRAALFVPDSLPLTKLMKEFQKGKTHLAIVLDEFGGTFGIITLEDVLEELVGEIQDEYDSEAPPLVKQSDTIVLADGNVWPGDVNELLDSDLPEEKAETLAGLFIDTIGRFPEKNEFVQIEDVKLTVLSKEKNRILRLKIEKLANDLSDE